MLITSPSNNCLIDKMDTLKPPLRIIRKNVARKSTSNRPLKSMNNALVDCPVSISFKLESAKVNNYTTSNTDCFTNVTKNISPLHGSDSNKPEILNESATHKHYSPSLYTDKSFNEIYFEESDDENDLIDGIFSISTSMLPFLSESNLSPPSFHDSSDESLNYNNILNYPIKQEFPILPKDLLPGSPYELCNSGSSSDLSDTEGVKCNSDKKIVKVETKDSPTRVVTKNIKLEKSDKSDSKTDCSNTVVTLREDVVLCENKSLKMTVLEANELDNFSDHDSECDSESLIPKVVFAMSIGNADPDLLDMTSLAENNTCGANMIPTHVETNESYEPIKNTDKLTETKVTDKPNESEIADAKETEISDAAKETEIADEAKDTDDAIEKSVPVSKKQKYQKRRKSNANNKLYFGYRTRKKTRSSSKQEPENKLSVEYSDLKGNSEKISNKDQSLKSTESIEDHNSINSVEMSQNSIDECKTAVNLETVELSSSHVEDSDSGISSKEIRETRNNGSNERVGKGKQKEPKKRPSTDKKCKKEINEGVLLHVEAAKKTNIMRDGKILKDKKELLKDIESKIEKNIPVEVKDFDIQQSLTEEILLDQALRLAHQRTSPRRRPLLSKSEAKAILNNLINPPSNKRSRSKDNASDENKSVDENASKESDHIESETSPSSSDTNELKVKRSSRIDKAKLANTTSESTLIKHKEDNKKSKKQGNSNVKKKTGLKSNVEENIVDNSSPETVENATSDTCGSDQKDVLPIGTRSGKKLNSKANTNKSKKNKKRKNSLEDVTNETEAENISLKENEDATSNEISSSKDVQGDKRLPLLIIKNNRKVTLRSRVILKNAENYESPIDNKELIESEVSETNNTSSFNNSSFDFSFGSDKLVIDEKEEDDLGDEISYLEQKSIDTKPENDKSENAAISEVSGKLIPENVIELDSDKSKTSTVEKQDSVPIPPENASIPSHTETEHTGSEEEIMEVIDMDLSDSSRTDSPARKSKPKISEEQIIPNKSAPSSIPFLDGSELNTNSQSKDHYSEESVMCIISEADVSYYNTLTSSNEGKKSPGVENVKFSSSASTSTIDSMVLQPSASLTTSLPVPALVSSSSNLQLAALSNSSLLSTSVNFSLTPEVIQSLTSAVTSSRQLSTPVNMPYQTVQASSLTQEALPFPAPFVSTPITSVTTSLAYVQPISNIPLTDISKAYRASLFGASATSTAVSTTVYPTVVLPNNSLYGSSSAPTSVSTTVYPTGVLPNNSLYNSASPLPVPPPSPTKTMQYLNFNYPHPKDFQPQTSHHIPSLMSVPIPTSVAAAAAELAIPSESKNPQAENDEIEQQRSSAPGIEQQKSSTQGIEQQRSSAPGKDIPLCIVARDPRLRKRNVRVIIDDLQINPTIKNDDKSNKVDIESEKITDLKSDEKAAVGKEEINDDKPEEKSSCLYDPEISEDSMESQEESSVPDSPKKKTKKKEIDQELLYKTPLSDLHDIPERSSYSRTIPRRPKHDHLRPFRRKDVEVNGTSSNPYAYHETPVEHNYEASNSVPDFSLSGDNRSSYQGARYQAPTDYRHNETPEDSRRFDHHATHRFNTLSERPIEHSERRKPLLEPPTESFHWSNSRQRENYSEHPSRSQNLSQDYRHQSGSSYRRKNNDDPSFTRWDYAHRKVEGTFPHDSDSHSVTRKETEGNELWEDENEVRDLIEGPGTSEVFYRRKRFQKTWKSSYLNDDGSSSPYAEDLFERRSRFNDEVNKRVPVDKPWESVDDEELINGPLWNRDDRLKRDDVRIRRDERRNYRSHRENRGRSRSPRRDYEMYEKKRSRSPRRRERSLQGRGPDRSQVLESPMSPEPETVVSSGPIKYLPIPQ